MQKQRCREHQRPKCCASLTLVHLSPPRPSLAAMAMQSFSNADWKARAEKARESIPEYEGERNGLGQMHGSGSETFPSGDSYDGEFKENRYDGRGTFSYINGNVYEGEYKAGWKEGQGTYRWKTGEVYEGGWKANKRHGHGTFTTVSGDVFEGDYRENKREGGGMWRFADGRIDVNQYKADAPVGDGVMWRADGETAVRLNDGKCKEVISLEEARRIVGESPYLKLPEGV